MVIEIRGFVLPPLLEKFLNDGTWTNKRSITIPEEMLSAVGIEMEMSVRLYDLQGLIQENSNTLLEFQPKLTDDQYKFFDLMCGWASSKRAGKPITDTTKLDVDYALCIASELSDDIICLDYRFDKNNPRIVTMDWANRQWKVLAPDFDTFAKGIGLIE